MIMIETTTSTMIFVRNNNVNIENDGININDDPDCFRTGVEVTECNSVRIKNVEYLYL